MKDLCDRPNAHAIKTETQFETGNCITFGQTVIQERNVKASPNIPPFEWESASTVNALSTIALDQS